MTLRKEIVAAHAPGSGEDYNPYNLPLVWGSNAGEGKRVIDRIGETASQKSSEVAGEVSRVAPTGKGDVRPNVAIEGKALVAVEDNEKTFDSGGVFLRVFLFSSLFLQSNFYLFLSCQSSKNWSGAW